ncbi:hypothetical protein JAAARDRAFT_141232 [Jaapia argillacea MUCL 33604]|uniref:Metallothionein n=1 Tax=Jaapia argillacea MUCL 33604 TaxID=933084 RepID=A0A067P7T3_9AGAM|nr:hypothetical protein JAAARDRAFT_141232 [Jaapia argillacea MUCL 33604]
MADVCMCQSGCSDCGPQGTGCACKKGTCECEKCVNRAHSEKCECKGTGENCKCAGTNVGCTCA